MLVNFFFSFSSFLICYTVVDVGCAELIIDGKVKVKQGAEVARLTETGVIFTDDTSLEADVIILAYVPLFLSHFFLTLTTSIQYRPQRHARQAAQDPRKRDD